jgi:hypothetical protein
MKSNSRSTVEKYDEEFSRRRTAPVEVTVHLKFSFKKGERLFFAFLYIPVNFSFGGGK